MFETLIVIAIVLAVAIVAVLIIAATKPDSFSVQRATVINAPADRVFPLIADFHEWRKWSPWEDRDPELKRTYDGAERGKGAIYAWEGNKNVGSGRMEILDANSPSLVKIKLDFLKPFEAHNIAEFTMLPQGNATNLNWVMQRTCALHVEGDAGVHEFRQDDRQGFRDRPRQDQIRFREIITTPARSKR